MSEKRPMGPFTVEQLATLEERKSPADPPLDGSKYPVVATSWGDKVVINVNSPDLMQDWYTKQN